MNPDLDLPVFFDPSVFAVECTRVRASVPDALFAAILGVVDESMFDGHVLAGATRLRFATGDVDLLEGDLVQAGGESYRVARQADRVNDGAESEALIVPAA